MIFFLFFSKNTSSTNLILSMIINHSKTLSSFKILSSFSFASTVASLSSCCYIGKTCCSDSSCLHHSAFCKSVLLGWCLPTTCTLNHFSRRFCSLWLTRKSLSLPSFTINQFVTNICSTHRSIRRIFEHLKWYCAFFFISVARFLGWSTSTFWLLLFTTFCPSFSS